MLFQEYPYLIKQEEWALLSISEQEGLRANQKKIYDDLASQNQLDVAHLTMGFLKDFSKRDNSAQPTFLRRMLEATGIMNLLRNLHKSESDESDNFTEAQKNFLRRMLVATGIKEKDKNFKDKDIFILMAQIGNSEKLKRWRSSAQISMSDRGSALISAAKNGHVSCVKQLIEKDYSSIIMLSENNEALRLAAQNGHLLCVKQLMENIPLFLEYAKNNALLSAAQNGHVLCVEYLIEKCGTQIKAEYNGYALKSAAENGHVLCVEYLIEKCGTQIKAEDNGYALIFAAQNGHVECVRCLIEKCGEQIESDFKITALLSAVQNGHVECVRCLIEKCGEQIESDFKITALLLAVQENNKEIVKILIRIPDIISKAVLSKGVECQDHDIIHLLALEGIKDKEHRYKQVDGTLGYGMTEALRLVLEGERSQQLRNNALYFFLCKLYRNPQDFEIKRRENSFDLTEEQKELFARFFILSPELQEKILENVNYSPLDRTSKQTNKIRNIVYPDKKPMLLSYPQKRSLSETSGASENDDLVPKKRKTLTSQ